MPSFRVVSLSLCFCVVSLTFAEFNPRKHVFYEMHCRFANQSTRTTLHDIDTNILDQDNLIEHGDGSNQSIDGIQNCKWNWRPERPTRIFIHGYYSDHDTLTQYARAYLDRGDYNFIAINWLKGAKTINYVKARHRVREVGKAVARFVDYLVTLGLNLDELIMVGHSLGAHICGIAGKHMKNGKPYAIIGLDPALPLFHLKNVDHRLHYSDAKYVQIIHTSGGFLGVKHPIGHADFYPNFGCVQPSCKSIIPFAGEVCAHQRVHDLFIESLKNTSQFWAAKCASYGEIYEQKCSDYGLHAMMGGDIENMEKAFGLFYLQTNNKSPYALYRVS